jgi:hypothetical protein
LKLGDYEDFIIDTYALLWFNEYMLHLLQLWYIQSGPWVVQRYLGSIRVFDGTFAIGDTWRNMGRPLFQDYTWQGRAIGVGLRIVRILLGAFIYFLTAIVYTVAWIIWLILPFIFVISLVGGFIAPSMRTL